MAISRKRLRERRFKQMPYENVKAAVRVFGLKTKEQYLTWHHLTRPIWTPRYPPRVYGDEWEGWSSFLGTQNVFGARNLKNQRDGSKFLPYWEGVRFVQKQAGEFKLTSAGAYRKWHKANEDKLDMLPRYPDTFYKEWQGWNVWLGKTIEGKLLGAVEALEEIGILGLVKDKSLPQNVASIVKCLDGKQAFIDLLRNKGLTFVRAYQYSNEDEQMFWKIINHFSRPYQGVDAERLCGMGAVQMISELDMALLKVNFS